MVDLDDLLTVAGVAELVGISKSSVYTYHYRGTMPRPHAIVGQSPVWKRAEIIEWKKTRPGRGRPAFDKGTK